MAKLLVWATGLLFFLYGVAFLFAPAEMAVLVTGDSPHTSSGVTDLRATYGGMSVAVGIVLFILASSSDYLRFALLSIAIIMLAMAAGRSLGMVLDGSPNVTMYAYLAAEIVVAGLALWLRTSVGRVQNT